MSYPVTTTSVVLGKYLAMLTVYAIPLLISCLCPLVISTGFTSSFLIDYSSIFAFLCLGTLFVSVGMYISTLTESVVIAAVGTMAAILLILLWATLVNMIPEKSWLIPVKDFLHLFGTASVLTNFTSMHVFDFKGIILLLAESAFFVILTVRSVSGRRWR
jgi:ABC-2 type transport system permease protein